MPTVLASSKVPSVGEPAPATILRIKLWGENVKEHDQYYSCQVVISQERLQFYAVLSTSELITDDLGYSDLNT